MKRWFGIMLVVCLLLAGCGSKNIQEDNTSIVIGETGTRILTVSYLKNNPKIAPMVANMTAMMVNYLRSDEAIGTPLFDFLNGVYKEINEKELSDIEKIELISLIDIVPYEALRWLGVSPDSVIDKNLKFAMIQCAIRMNSIAGDYIKAIGKASLPVKPTVVPSGPSSVDNVQATIPAPKITFVGDKKKK